MKARSKRTGEHYQASRGEGGDAGSRKLLRKKRTARRDSLLQGTRHATFGFYSSEKEGVEESASFNRRQERRGEMTKNGIINIKRKMRQEKQPQPWKTETEKNCLLRDASSVVRNLARCFYEKY